MGKRTVGSLNSSDHYRPLSIEEKQDILTANGESWPACECHGVSKIWNPWSAKGGGYWQCRIKKQENSQKQRAIRKAKGLCPTCAKSWRECMCRSRRDIYRYDKMINKYSKLNALDKDDPRYIAIVRKERSIND